MLSLDDRIASAEYISPVIKQGNQERFAIKIALNPLPSAKSSSVSVYSEGAVEASTRSRQNPAALQGGAK
jgi:hypothetical protein